ncbi:MAG: hypothetical protein ACKO1I_14670 [Microcystis aeruginosa]
MIESKAQLREAFSLWMPAEASKELLLDLTLCRDSLDELLSGKLSFNNFLEILDNCNVDVDDYCEIVDDNLSILQY